PAHALARRGMQVNVVGYESTGGEAPAIIRAVVNGQVDTAVVWGPLAGYFAEEYPQKLTLTPVKPEVDPPGLPFTYTNSWGVNTIQVSELHRGGQQIATPSISNIYEENAYAVSEGKRLYENFNCVGCHSHGGGGIGPPLMDNDWIYGAEPANIFSTIMEGRPN